MIVAVITSQADVPAPPALAGVMRKEMTDELAWSMRPKSAAADAADVILMVTEGPRCSMAASASVSACKTAGSCRAASDTPLMVIVTVTADCAATDGVTIKLDDIESEGEDGSVRELLSVKTVAVAVLVAAAVPVAEPVPVARPVREVVAAAVVEGVTAALLLAVPDAVPDPEAMAEEELELVAVVAEPVPVAEPVRKVATPAVRVLLLDDVLVLVAVCESARLGGDAEEDAGVSVAAMLDDAVAEGVFGGVPAAERVLEREAAHGVGDGMGVAHGELAHCGRSEYGCVAATHLCAFLTAWRQRTPCRL